MHTLAVLRRTNCFSLRQISCKSRLCRQHCPSPPGGRDGRQADGARGRGEGGGGGTEWSVCTRGASEQDGGGRREGGEGVGAIPWEWRETEREKKALTLQECLYPLSLCSSIAQAECPQPLTPLPSEAPLLLRSSNTPFLIPPLLPALRSLLCPHPCPPLSLLHSLPLHRSTEKWRKDETLQRGKKNQ